MWRVCLFFLGLALVTVPRLAAAAVVVTAPTGDAAPEFLAELKASLETVATEAPAELNAELRSSATNNEAGWELVVELVPSAGGEPIRETRVASKASALAQARAMGRAALKALAPNPDVASVSAVAVAGDEAVVSDSPKPDPATLVRYDRRRSLALSLWPTSLLVVTGALMLFVLPEAVDGDGHIVFSYIVGPSLVALGAVFGPSIGYFYLRKPGRALGMSAIRLTFAVAAAWTLIEYFLTQPGWDECNGTGDEREVDACMNERRYPALLPIGIVAAVAAVALAYVDAALVGRAADRANAQWREQNKPKIQVAPVAWSNGHGDGTFGLAVSGTF